MNKEDAEEFTESLGQVVGGGWRMAALGERLGVPEALGLSTRDWVQQKLGGYIKLSITERREAVAELTEEGMTTREIGDVLGVGKTTVARTQKSEPVPNGTEPASKPKVKPEPVPNGTEHLDLDPDTETVCPTCHGSGRVLLNGGS